MTVSLEFGFNLNICMETTSECEMDDVEFEYGYKSYKWVDK